MSSRAVRRDGRSWAICALWAATGLMFGGCGFDGGQGDGWNVGSSADAGAAGGDATADGEGGNGEQSQSTTFALHNESDGTLRLRRRGTCSGDPSWVRMRGADGDAVMEPSCGACLCEHADSDQCGGCLADCAPRPAATLEPGETREMTWDGIAYQTDEVGGKSCRREWIPPEGRQLSVEFCTVEGPDSFEARECKTVSFEYGRDTEVEASFGSGSNNSVETTFVLENDSAESIEVVEPSSCSTNDEAWVSLTDRGVPVDFERDCTICSCESLDECAVCKKRCASGMAESVPGGEQVELTWDGVGHRRQPIDTEVGACHERWVPERGEDVTTQFCWRSGDGAETTCAETTFEYGEGRSVRHVVE